jgi:IS4 transposase
LRTKENTTSRLVKTLSDGSKLIDVDVRHPQTSKLLGTLRLRDIEAEASFEGREKPVKLRLWTSLLDHEAHPALALVELYATRWEHELFYRELKSHLHGRANLLDAQPPETAAQEALALLMAAAATAPVSAPRWRARPAWR